MNILFYFWKHLINIILIDIFIDTELMITLSFTIHEKATIIIYKFFQWN